MASEPKSPEIAELEAFDWFGHKGPTGPVFQPEIWSIMQLKDPSAEAPYDRKLRMLRQLSIACTACSMCELGQKEALKGNIARDPHVFSNLNPTRFMVVGQNPGWNELEKRSPFVGAAGKNFDTALQTYGLTRNAFYITNAVKCFTKDNAKPDNDHQAKCKPFLDMEINLIKPKLIVTLGASAFGLMCPDMNYGESLCKIVKSTKFNNLPVLPIYHPSPLNLADPGRRTEFYRQIKILCGLVTKLQEG